MSDASPSHRPPAHIPPIYSPAPYPQPAPVTAAQGPPRLPTLTPMPDSASTTHSFAADLSMGSVKTEDSASVGEPNGQTVQMQALQQQQSMQQPQQGGPQGLKGKNGATGPADNKPKPHVCNVCQRGFTTGGHLQRHQRIHTGVKAFKCPFPGCETRTSRQDNLQQHYRTHLSPTLRRGSGSAARAAVNAAMEAAGLKSSTARQPRKSKSATGTPTSASTPHFPSPYPPQAGPNPYAPYMYDQAHYPPPYPIPPSMSMAQPPSASSSRVPSPTNPNGHPQHAHAQLPPAHQPSFFAQPHYTQQYPSYAVPPQHQQTYRYPAGTMGYAPAPGGYAHHGLYGTGMPEQGHMYNPMQFQHREGSYGLPAAAYGGGGGGGGGGGSGGGGGQAQRSPTANGYGHPRR
ncbi:transcriptional regulator Nrg1 [Cryptococcus wingfieldii CBS 7118]|uniref:Transcriptional regulator Nrg1 n=1 Tax=Cryptococcus wingfieldii CBS 7118 TaxID=1295528 RepID=A0A1E3K046_9TREE|nr:transcriptional regulator Nrg1 [Cryptococcus wingfieldii CBS 7118]ODO06470.1 transcriptional regulator Nrg1 [Cryptococcus wingfieldii CBS 7118]